MHFRKSYEVVGYASEGAAYCADCALGVGFEEDDEGAIFLDDADDLTCDQCGDRLDGEDNATESEEEDAEERS